MKKKKKKFDPDQDQLSVCPDLDPIGLLRLSANNKVDASKESIKTLGQAKVSP